MSVEGGRKSKKNKIHSQEADDINESSLELMMGRSQFDGLSAAGFSQATRKRDLKSAVASSSSQLTKSQLEIFNKQNQKLPIPKENIVAIDASLSSAEAMARDYERRMAQAFSTSAAGGASEVRHLTALICTRRPTPRRPN